MSQLRVIGLVPAKLTSLRIPRKNLQKIEGIELFIYSIRAALKSRLIDRVYVSSESSELLNSAQNEGAWPISRPQNLSGHDVTNQAVLVHALNHIETKTGITPEIIVLLQPTHPFRVPTDIDRAIAYMKEDEHASCIFALTPKKTLTGRLDRECFIPDVPLPRHRDKELPKFENSGSFYIFNVARSLMAGKFFGDDIRGLMLSRPELEIDIDEPLDLELARTIARYFKSDLKTLGLIESNLT